MTIDWRIARKADRAEKRRERRAAKLLHKILRDPKLYNTRRHFDYAERLGVDTSRLPGLNVCA